jgi:UDP:flavonoid glycosyltransferase YjiC (YdhE family)
MKTLKAIVIGLGSAGDVHPNIGLALALRDRGLAVLFVGPEVFRPLAERTGIDFVGIGSKDEYYAAIADPDLWHPIRSFSVVARRLILPAMRPVYEVIQKNFEPGRTVVAAPGFAFGARIAQEKLRAPLATVHLQPIMFRSAIHPGCFGFPDIVGHLPPALRKVYFRAADRLFVDRWLVEPVNAFRAELGLRPVQRLFDRWIHSPQLVIGLFPDWYAQPQPDWPPKVALTGFPLWDEREIRSVSQELEDFLAAGEPPLVFTAGSAMLQAKRFFDVSAEVCDSTGRRGLFLTQFREQLPARLPAGVRHFAYIPFSAVLPRTAALVHHGGIGTTAQAIWAGIPQLIVPYAHDQPDNAVRVRRLGLGDYLLPGAYTAKRVTQKLDALMNRTVKDTCQQAAALVGSEMLQAASILIEELAIATNHSQPRDRKIETDFLF